MVTNVVMLKKAFKIALMVSGITQAEWARKNKVMPQYVNNVLSGRFVSLPFVRKINAFIREHVQEVKAICQDLENAA